MNMKNLKLHQVIVENCLKMVNYEIKNVNLQGKTNEYKENTKEIIILRAAVKYKLPLENVRMIYFGKEKIR